METIQPCEFGGDPFPVTIPKRPDPERGRGPGEGTRKDEESERDDREDCDLGGGD